MATAETAKTFKFIGGAGTPGTDQTQPGSFPGTAAQGTDGASTTDKNGNKTCTKQPGNGVGGGPGGPGLSGGEAGPGLDSSPGTLKLGKITGSVVIEIGGGNGGKGGAGGPGGPGGNGGPPGANPGGCTNATSGPAGCGGKGGTGGQGGNGGNGATVVITGELMSGASITFDSNHGVLGGGGDPGAPGAPGTGTGGGGNLGGGAVGPKGEHNGKPGQVIFNNQPLPPSGS